MAKGVVFGGMALLTALRSLTAQAQGYGHHFDHGYYDGGWNHMIFGSLGMILVWGALIVLIVLAVRWFGAGWSGETNTPPAEKSPLDILKERYARGEIDKQEFEERKELLSG
jgi:putative membrane protein